MPSTLVPHPKPGDTCPGRPSWERHRGQEWLVFVDESFFMFFELTAKGGYFCHAAVGIPEREYPGFKARFEPIFRDYAKLIGESVTELKHSDFKRLGYRDRRKLAVRIRDALAAHRAFVAGFYTPVRAFVLERVRVKLLDEAEEIPEDHDALYDEAARELKAGHTGPGQSGVITKLMWLAAVSVANLLASLDADYKIICDPRERKEDKVVRASVADLIAATGNLRNVSGSDLRDDLDLHFRGIESSRSSDQEVGLQLADLMVGEVCGFLKANDDFLTYAATRRLVTPTSEEAVNTVTLLNGQVFKTGVLHRMPAGLRRRFLRPDPADRTVFPYFRELLAAGTLTCYSALGQPRDLMVFEGLIWDGCD